MSLPSPTVAPLTTEQYEDVLPLIASYQRFYRVEQPDEERNREFFRRFLDPSPVGLLLGAWADDSLAGFACLYWTFSSVSATKVVLLNDLFVREEARGRGTGRALIDAAVAVARSRGAASVRWYTEADNHAAQRVYDRTGASRSAWFEYELEA